MDLKRRSIVIFFLRAIRIVFQRAMMFQNKIFTPCIMGNNIVST